MVRKTLEVYVYDEDDKVAVSEDTRQLDNLESGVWSASVFRKDPEWLRISLKLNKLRAAELLLDDLGVPGDMDLKQRIAYLQLVEID